MDLLASINYLYGTIVFSSMSLVSGVNAIEVVLVYGIVALVTRVLTAFVLRGYRGVVVCISLANYPIRQRGNEPVYRRRRSILSSARRRNEVIML